MAELNITEAEKEAARYLDWSDEALGKAVKKIALLIQDEDGKRAIPTVGAASFLIDRAITANAESSIIDLRGLTEVIDGEVREIGDWRITIQRLDTK